jgi:hypothetical protein
METTIYNGFRPPYNSPMYSYKVVLEYPYSNSLSKIIVATIDDVFDVLYKEQSGLDVYRKKFKLLMDTYFGKDTWWNKNENFPKVPGEKLQTPVDTMKSVNIDLYLKNLPVNLANMEESQYAFSMGPRTSKKAYFDLQGKFLGVKDGKIMDQDFYPAISLSGKLSAEEQCKKQVDRILKHLNAKLGFEIPSELEYTLTNEDSATGQCTVISRE